MAKRIASSSTDWNLLFKYVYPHLKPELTKLKIKSDKYFKQLIALPPELPKIDWNFYKNKITKPGMLETFQKNYENIQIPYPGDDGLIAHTEKTKKKAENLYEENLANFNKDLLEAEEKLKKLKSEKKMSEMTLDEFCYTYPEYNKFQTEIYPVYHVEKLEKKVEEEH